MHIFRITLTILLLLASETAVAQEFNLNFEISLKNGQEPETIEFAVSWGELPINTSESEFSIGQSVQAASVPKGVDFLMATASYAADDGAFSAPLISFNASDLPDEAREKSSPLTLSRPNNSDFRTFENSFYKQLDDDDVPGAATTLTMLLWSSLMLDEERQIVFLDIFGSNKGFFIGHPEFEQLILALNSAERKFAANPNALRKYWLLFASFAEDDIDGVRIGSQSFGEWRKSQMTDIVSRNFGSIYFKVSDALRAQISAGDYEDCASLGKAYIDAFLEQRDDFEQLNRVRTHTTRVLRAAVDECLLKDFLISNGLTAPNVGPAFRQHVNSNDQLKEFATAFIEMADEYYGGGFNTDSATGKILQKYYIALE